MQSALEVGPAAPAGDLPPLAELMGQFHSLGDNCEFGMVQRFCGAEPLGLLRFNWTTMPALLDLLADRFAQIGRPELIEIYQEPSTQYMVRHHPYQLRYHTFLYPGDITTEKLARAETTRLTFLKRAFIEDLEDGNRILVRKGDDSASLESVLTLLAAIRRYGPSPLLWVTRADAEYPAGTVERLADGLLHGYVDRFAPYHNAHDVSVASWVQVCANAVRLLRAPESCRVAFPAPEPAAANSFAGSDWFAPAEFASLDGGRNALVPEAAAAGGPVLCHVLPAAEGAFTGELGGGPAAAVAVPGELYVASAQVWLPACYSGDIAGLVIAGKRSVRVSNASLARRDCWQRPHVSALAPPDATPLWPSLYVSGAAGDVLFTTAWKLESGIAPTAVRPPTGADRPDPLAELAGVAPPPRTLPDLLRRFESLGDNCEFGMVQRQGGVENLGFFRFASAPLAPLMRALESGFDRVGEPDLIDIRRGHAGEHMVSVQPFGFEYHTFRFDHEISAEALRAAEATRLAFLQRKLIEDLQAGEKIFVRKGSASEAEMRALAEALRRYGPATLLWVTPEDAANPAGTVLRLGETLLRGYISRFAPGEAVMSAAVHDWVEICRNADLLRRLPAAVRVEGRVPEPRPNLLPEGSDGPAAQWFRPAHGQAIHPPAPLHPGCAIMAHAGGEAGGATPFGGMVRAGLQPGAMHVASAWVWLPASFTGTVVSLVIDGLASIRICGARLAERETWQRIWTSARFPADRTKAQARLYLAAPSGTVIFSTCWKLEPGVVPTEYLPRTQA